MTFPFEGTILYGLANYYGISTHSLVFGTIGAHLTCYRVYELLRSTKSLKKYSVGGVLQEYLSGIRIDKITGYWRYEVMTKSNKKLLKQLSLKFPDSPTLSF